jgi:hypothetical protein
MKKQLLRYVHPTSDCPRARLREFILQIRPIPVEQMRIGQASRHAGLFKLTLEQKLVKETTFLHSYGRQLRYNLEQLLTLDAMAILCELNSDLPRQIALRNDRIDQLTEVLKERRAELHAFDNETEERHVDFNEDWTVFRWYQTSEARIPDEFRGLPMHRTSINAITSVLAYYRSSLEISQQHAFCMSSV